VHRGFVDLAVLPFRWRRRRFTARQVALKQNRGGHAIDGSLAFFAADIGGDQQIFRRFGRHPLIPQHERNRQPLFQSCGKFPHGLDRRTFPPIQLKRKSQHHLPNLMGAHEGGDVSDITVERPSLERFKRLGRPPQFIAESDADPLGPVIQSQYP